MRSSDCARRKSSRPEKRFAGFSCCTRVSRTASAIPAVGERNILVTNMQRIGGPIIAEHVIAMTLAFTRGLDLYITARPSAEWRRLAPPGRMEVVDGKTMLVVGLGGIGSEVAKRAHALGMKVIATRASGRSGPEFVSYVGLPDELPKLAGEADFVVNTAPLTPQTTGIFDAAFFATHETRRVLHQRRARPQRGHVRARSMH